MASGVYKTNKKDGSVYYRVSITHKNKHISLGSFDDENIAFDVYSDAKNILNSNLFSINIETLTTTYSLCKSLISFDKFITLLNYRDNNIYIKTPIYLCHKYFLYFLSQETVLYFNVDDLFYYSNHKILSRGNYYYVNDYGMQLALLSRYGIKPHAVMGRDYIFRNNNPHDFRYENIQVINKYFGVTQLLKNGRVIYKTKIHINGDYIIGTYNTENEAAIAYNKAVHLIQDFVNIRFTQNYIEDISKIEYAATYNRIRISKKFLDYVTSISQLPQ